MKRHAFDNFGFPAAPKKCEPNRAKFLFPIRSNRPAVHPDIMPTNPKTFLAKVIAAVRALKDFNGSSRQAIQKYIKRKTRTTPFAVVVARHSPFSHFSPSHNRDRNPPHVKPNRRIRR